MKFVKVTREQAISSALKFFYTGRPCAHGHDSQRYTSTGHCTQCLRERSATLQRNAKRAYIDRIRGYFAYPLHPADHAAALAYCQALDIARGRPPQELEPLVVDQRLANIDEVLRDLKARNPNVSALPVYLPKL